MAAMLTQIDVCLFFFWNWSMKLSHTMSFSFVFVPVLFFQYFLYSNHAPIAKTTMHPIVPNIEPATAPPQLPDVSLSDADIVESAIFILQFDQAINSIYRFRKPRWFTCCLKCKKIKKKWRWKHYQNCSSLCGIFILFSTNISFKSKAKGIKWKTIKNISENTHILQTENEIGGKDREGERERQFEHKKKMEMKKYSSMQHNTYINDTTMENNVYSNLYSNLIHSQHRILMILTHFLWYRLCVCAYVKLLSFHCNFSVSWALTRFLFPPLSLAHAIQDLSCFTQWIGCKRTSTIFSLLSFSRFWPFSLFYLGQWSYNATNFEIQVQCVFTLPLVVV